LRKGKKEEKRPSKKGQSIGGRHAKNGVVVGLKNPFGYSRMGKWKNSTQKTRYRKGKGELTSKSSSHPVRFAGRKEIRGERKSGNAFRACRNQTKGLFEGKPHPHKERWAVQDLELGLIGTCVQRGNYNRMRDAKFCNLKKEKRFRGFQFSRGGGRRGEGKNVPVIAVHPERKGSAYHLGREGNKVSARTQVSGIINSR